MKRFGILYFLDKNPAFRKMLRISVSSVKKYHPTIPIKIVEIESFSVPAWKTIYRLISFWKWIERARRQNQDWRIIFAKASGMIDTPFENTLYLDVDTVLMKPIDNLMDQAMEYDVMATPLDGKYYNGFDSWHPSRFPMVMAGVVFYSKNFLEIYREYVDRLSDGAGKYFAGDQYMFSMTCEMESENLRILLEPYLQIDTMNLEKHLRRKNFPRREGVLDLRYEGLNNFHIFHYNGPHKREYLKQIKEVWGFSSDG